jgi:hypothetical protein
MSVESSIPGSDTKNIEQHKTTIESGSIIRDRQLSRSLPELIFPELLPELTRHRIGGPYWIDKLGANDRFGMDLAVIGYLIGQ